MSVIATIEAGDMMRKIGPFRASERVAERPCRPAQYLAPDGCGSAAPNFAVGVLPLRTSGHVSSVPRRGSRARPGSRARLTFVVNQDDEVYPASSGPNKNDLLHVAVGGCCC